MYVIEVIPLQRGIQIESLSYFSSHTYPLGTFISIPVRGKQVTGVVIEQKPVSTTKTALKAATFSLRKLPKQTPLGAVPKVLLATVATLTKAYPAKSGALLYALLPPDVRNGTVPYPAVRDHVGHEDPTPQILQGPREERFVSYRSQIRSTFAHRGSVLFIVPTSVDVAIARGLLEAGIEDRVVTFSPRQSKKERLRAYELFNDLSIAKLIITTPSHAYLEREDLTTIILEQSASTYYTMRTRPYLDHHTVLLAYAKESGRELLWGDIVARTRDEQLRRSERYHTYGEAPKRFALPSKLTIINQKDKPTKDTPFRLFSKELVNTITHTLEGRGNAFLLAARRGLAPVVACFDCGHIFRCPDSGTPYSLLRTYEQGDQSAGVTAQAEEKRWFLSSTSGKRVPAADVCENCGSWRLRERGIGIQSVFDECKQQFPDAPTIQFDHTTAKTYKRAEELAESFYKHKGAILIGTNMVLSYLHKPVDTSVVVSLDATRSTPTWKADEQLFRTLLMLRERSKNEVLVQSRSGTDDLLTYASRAAVERFFDDELKLRDMLHYPPFAVFVLLSWSGSPEVLSRTETIIKQQVNISTARFYTSPTSTPQKTVHHCLLRIDPERWPDVSLMDSLRSLPPYIKVEINPDRIV